MAQGTPSLELSHLGWAQGGYYTVIASNPWGSVTNRAILSLNDLHMYAGIRIAGAPGANYQVEARNSMDAEDN